MSSILSIIFTSLIVTFLFSALPKIIHLKDFIELVKNYEVLPEKLSLIFAILLPLLELFAVYLLIQEIIWGLILLTILLFSFLYAVNNAIKKKKEIRCGCFGKFIDAKADKYTLVKIIFLLFFTFLALIISFVNVEIIYTTGNIIIGALLSIMFIAIQVIWTNSQQFITSIQKERKIQSE